MKQATTIKQIRETVARARMAGRRIGLAPTMGNLHAGHGSLIAASAADGNFTVVTIFVNPTQFGPNEDFQSYPRTPEQDLGLCEARGADAVFLPSVEEVYPGRRFTTVSVEKLTERLCGASRPGHFDGVCTVVSKLFNMVQPDAAYFGRKDAQQLAVIRRMTADLNFPVEIVGCDIVREADGLAMSSRNAYLTADERREALALSGSLALAGRLAAEGRRDCGELIAAVKRYIQDKAPGGAIDYVETVGVDDIQPVETIEPGAEVLLAVAVRFGRARLIDNVILRA